MSMSKTHIATGITAGLVCLTFTQPNLREYLPGIILGSTMPDIDTEKSWISQAIPFVDDKLRKLGVLKHRGITHGLSGIIAIIIMYIRVSAIIKRLCFFFSFLNISFWFSYSISKLKIAFATEVVICKRVGDESIARWVTM